VGVALVVADHQTPSTLAMRERAAMVDLTAFATLRRLRRRGARCRAAGSRCGKMDVAVGRFVYTPLLTPSGTFKQDLNESSAQARTCSVS